jgi:hypothetical protein
MSTKSGKPSTPSESSAKYDTEVITMDKEKKLAADAQTRAFQHGFMIGFMNGARVATEAFNVAVEQAINASIEGSKAADVYLGQSCRSPLCCNFRPCSTKHCSPECEATERAWGEGTIPASARIH